MLNLVKNATRLGNQVIIGEQIFVFSDDLLHKFTNLDRLFSPDFVFKKDSNEPQWQFMSYQVAQALFTLLTKKQPDLRTYQVDQLAKMLELAQYLGYTDFNFFAPVLN